MLRGCGCLNNFFLPSQKKEKKKKKEACHLFQHPLCILKSSLSGDGGSCEVRHPPPSPFSILFMHLYTRKAIKIMDKQAEQCYITFK